MKDTITEAKATLEKIKGDIVSESLDKLNGSKPKKSGCSKDKVDESYDFNKSILSAVYEGKGTVITGKS